MTPEKEIRTIEDLTFDDENPNAGTERGRKVIEESLGRLGAGRGPCTDRNGVILAGNKTLQVAAELGIPIDVVHTRGERLVVIVRDDLDIKTDSRARELSIADNRAAEVGLEWRVKLLNELRMRDSRLKIDYMFTSNELQKMADRSAARLAAAAKEAERTITCPNCGKEFQP